MARPSNTRGILVEIAQHNAHITSQSGVEQERIYERRQEAEKSKTSGK
jgi:hypothetical protein